MMDDPKTLMTADRAELLQSMEFGMKFHLGNASSAARDVAAHALAAMVLEHLEICGYVFMKRPPARGHSTP